jgi:hypothetical protein
MGVRVMATAFGQITRNRRGVSGERNLRSRRGLLQSHESQFGTNRTTVYVSPRCDGPHSILRGTDWQSVLQGSYAAVIFRHR